MLEAKGCQVQGWVLGKSFTHGVWCREGDDLYDVIHNLKYYYSEGNASCDCNKRIFAGLADVDDEDNPCGDSITYEKLSLVFDNGESIPLEVY